LLGQQANRPTIATFRSIAAGQRDQVSFGYAVELACLVTAAIAMLQGSLKSPLYKSMAESLWCSGSAIKRIGYRCITPTGARWSLIQFEEHLSMSAFVGSHPFSVDDVFKLGTFFSC